MMLLFIEFDFDDDNSGGTGAIFYPMGKIKAGMLAY